MAPVPVLARLVITWLAIFPLVVLAQFALRAPTDDWPWPLVTALIMAFVVPPAALGTIPALTRVYIRLTGARRHSGPRP